MRNRLTDDTPAKAMAATTAAFLSIPAQLARFRALRPAQRRRRSLMKIYAAILIKLGDFAIRMIILKRLLTPMAQASSDSIRRPRCSISMIRRQTGYSPASGKPARHGAERERRPRVSAHRRRQ